jgi:hypothetical protein
VLSVWKKTSLSKSGYPQVFHKQNISDNCS